MELDQDIEREKIYGSENFYERPLYKIFKDPTLKRKINEEKWTVLYAFSNRNIRAPVPLAAKASVWQVAYPHSSSVTSYLLICTT